MAAEIINLRKARKARVRAQAEQQAAENRTRFGRTRGERDLRKAEDELATRLIDGHRVVDPHEDESR